MNIKDIKEASFYRKLKDMVVQCMLCPRYCIISNGKRGKCGVRENKNGKLYSLVYARPCSINLDPIEKKPFYHFMPGKYSLSIATVGCNLHCKHCQNWEISQAKPEDLSYTFISPKKVVDKAKEANADIISYTYTEPTVFYEYMIDIAKIAKKNNIKNTIVSNGFINPEPLKKLCRYIDGANIDLKSISDRFYREICDARLKPVLESLKILKENKIWIEITNLVIPTLNDSMRELKKLVLWIKENLGKDVPLHFTAFYPTYKLSHLPFTSVEVLKKARQLALKEGMLYVYTGNIRYAEGSSTYCHKCGKVIISRDSYFNIIENNIVSGKCKFCKSEIAGVWI